MEADGCSVNRQGISLVNEQWTAGQEALLDQREHVSAKGLVDRRLCIPPPGEDLLEIVPFSSDVLRLAPLRMLQRRGRVQRRRISAMRG
jgi:hypothetical protein